MPANTPDRESVSTHFRDDHVVEDVLLLRWDTLARPPGLEPAYQRALAARDAEDLEALDRALRELAAAAMNSLTVLRKHTPTLLLHR